MGHDGDLPRLAVTVLFLLACCTPCKRVNQLVYVRRPCGQSGGYHSYGLKRTQYFSKEDGGYASSSHEKRCGWMSACPSDCVIQHAHKQCVLVKEMQKNLRMHTVRAESSEKNGILMKKREKSAHAH